MTTIKSCRPGARAVILCNEEILLLKDLSHPEPNYGLVGGGIEFGEGARAALGREIKEEIGVDLTISRFLGCFEQSFEHYRLGQLHDLTLLFLVIVSAQEKAQIVSQEERYQTEWVHIDEISKLNLVPPQLPSLLSMWIKQDVDSAFQSGF